MGSALSTFLDLYDKGKTEVKWKDVAVFTGFLALTWYLYKILVKPFTSPLRKIPGPPYRPIVGNMFDALKHEAMTNTIKWMKQYKSRFIRFYFLNGQENLLVADPEIVKYINVTNSKNYGKVDIKALLNGTVKDFVLSLDGSAHHALKKLLNPSFKLKVVEDNVPCFAEFAEKLVSVWNQQIEERGEPAVVKAQIYMTAVTLDVICMCGFGYSMNAIENPEKAGVYAFKRLLFGEQVRLTNLIPFLKLIPSKEKTQRKKDIALLKSIIINVLSEHKQMLKDNPEALKMKSNSNLLTSLVLAHDENGNPLNDEVIFSNVAGFMFAGFETTSHSLTWTLLNLAQHPDCQEKARKEVMSQITKGQPITAEDLEKMPYTACCIKESLRLFPPLTVYWRKPIHDDVIKGYFIPKGTPIGISVGALHRLHENWDDPDSFKPERFMEQIPHYKYIPFGIGPYMCLGNRFSMMESRTILAVLLQNFRFEMVPGFTFKRIATPVMQPKPPLILRVSRV